MAEKNQEPFLFKNVLDRNAIQSHADRIKSVYPSFRKTAFIKKAHRNWAQLELKERSLQISDALAEFLPNDFAHASDLLRSSMGEDDGSGGIEGMGGFLYLPLLDFVGKYGLETPEAAFDALEAMTLFFSAEFAIRPYIIRYPSLAFERLERWSQHKDWRLRRLASEGSRPRLPWGIRLRSLVKDPSPTRGILNRLVEDPELVVRRSVANHLNDIAKDHEDFAVEVAQDWWSLASEEAQWVVRHAMRTLIKQGHRDVLTMLGFRTDAKVRIEAFSITPHEIPIGAKVEFSFAVVSEEDVPIGLMVDYVLDRELKNGKRGRKVFKLRQCELAPGERIQLKKKQAFAQLSTRTYYPGTHHIEILLNGTPHGTVCFELQRA